MHGERDYSGENDEDRQGKVLQMVREARNELGPRSMRPEGDSERGESSQVRTDRQTYSQTDR